MTDSENRPTHYCYISSKSAKEGETDGEYKKGDLVKIGGAWGHKDGKGVSIPLGNARLIVREAKEFRDEESITSINET